MPSTAMPRSFRRSIFRGYVNEAERLGLMGGILRRVPPETAELLHAPTKAPAWGPGPRLGETLSAPAGHRDREAPADLGYRLAKAGRRGGWDVWRAGGRCSPGTRTGSRPRSRAGGCRGG